MRILLVNGSMFRGNVALGMDVAQIMERCTIYFQKQLRYFLYENTA
jgi:hypothetical protein